MLECNVPCKKQPVTITETLINLEMTIHNIEGDLDMLEELLIPIVEIQINEALQVPTALPQSACELSRTVEKLTEELEKVGSRIRTLSRIVRV